MPAALKQNHFINKSLLWVPHDNKYLCIIIAMQFDTESDKKNSYHISL